MSVSVRFAPVHDDVEAPISTKAPTSSSFVPAPGFVVAQKYRLETLLKRGGMGAVWTATHLGLDTTVAIKFMMTKLLELAPGLEPDVTPSDGGVLTRVRFEREAKAAARIRSSNVVQILDHGVDHGTPYIVMELLRGEDLSTRLKRVGRLSIDEMVPVVSAVARALQMAHDVELVHRDLKPDNIYLATEGDEEIPKVLDFGVAKAKGVKGDRRVDESTQAGTMAGTVVGTPLYMSPEQIQGRKNLDHRADLWSLGVVIYRALTGKLPFKAPTLLELVVEVCTAPIPKATSIAPDLPPSIDAFFERALCRDMNGRFQSAREMAAAFRELAGIPTSHRLSLTSGQFAIPAPDGATPSMSVSAASAPSLATGLTTADKPIADKPAKPDWRVVALGIIAAAALIGIGVGLTAWLKKPDSHEMDAAPSVTAAAQVAPSATVATVATPTAPSATAAEPAATQTAPAAPVSAAPIVTTNPLTTKPRTQTKTKERNVGY